MTDASFTMELTETERMLLRAMHRVQIESGGKKSVVTLRYALLESSFWSEDAEAALCNAGNEEPTVTEYYDALCRLVRDTPFADGAGDFGLPAGPRYTECWITSSGIQLLSTADEHDDVS